MGLKFKITSWILLIISLLIIFGSHIWVLVFGLPPEQMDAHAVINLVAGVFIINWAIAILTGRRR